MEEVISAYYLPPLLDDETPTAADKPKPTTLEPANMSTDAGNKNTGRKGPTGRGGPRASGTGGPSIVNPVNIATASSTLRGAAGLLTAISRRRIGSGRTRARGLLSRTGAYFVIRLQRKKM